jgi:hypothetical protein
LQPNIIALQHALRSDFIETTQPKHKKGLRGQCDNPPLILTADR